MCIASKIYLTPPPQTRKDTFFLLIKKEKNKLLTNIRHASVIDHTIQNSYLQTS